MYLSLIRHCNDLFVVVYKLLSRNITLAYTNLHPSTLLNMYMHMYVCVYIYIYIYLYMYIYVYMHEHIYIYIYTHSHTYTHIYFDIYHLLTYISINYLA